MTDLLDAAEPTTTFSAPSTPAERPRSTVTFHSGSIRSGSRLVDLHLAAGRDLDVLITPTGRTVVVVPHPDDEALAAGGLIAHQRARGREVVVVAVTDGDAAYPDWDGTHLARVRRREQLDALHRLGVGRHAVHRLGIPDGATTHHVDEISTALLDILHPGDTLVAPAVFDWHPDHEACGRAATAAADEIGCSLLGSLFWAHHHPDHAPSGLSLGVLALSDDEIAQRRAAVHAHRSQLESSPHTSADPILPSDLLGLLERPVEYYVLERCATLRPGGVA
jgi:LmbE family N-acetylglucosaminyl deacetylase